MEPPSIKTTTVGACYECPCYVDCCAPHCGLDHDLSFEGEERLAERRHSKCPLDKHTLLLRARISDKL